MGEVESRRRAIRKTRNFTGCFSVIPPQAIAHIRCLFSVLARRAPLSFLETSPIRLSAFPPSFP
jgi:hypothetical protein